MKIITWIRKAMRRLIPLSYRIRIANLLRRILDLPRNLLVRLVNLPTHLENFVRNRVATKLKQNLLAGIFYRPIDKIVRILLESNFSKNLKHFYENEVDLYRPNPKKVMLVIGTLGGGGAERQLVLLAKRLKAEGWEPVVVVNHLGRPEFRTLMPLLIHDSVRVLDLDSFKYSKSNFFPDKSAIPIFDASFRLVEVIRFERPQIVHSWMDYANCETLLASQWIRIPKIVLGIRSISPDNFPLWSPAFRPIYRRVRRGNVSLVSNSENGKRSYAKWLGLDDIDVIPNGVVLPVESKEVHPVTLEYRQKQNVIGCLRLSWEKGPDLWVEVARLVCRNKPDVHFHLFGEGPLRENLEKAVSQSNLEGRITLHGFLTNPWTKLDWDLHLSTSRMEGMPNVVMEASVHRIPTVAFKVGGIPEVLGEDCELLVNPFNTEDMATTIIKILESPNLRLSKANEAWTRVVEDLNIDSMTSRYISVYER